MNICYIANIRFPSERAQSTQIVAMCQAFSQLGYQTHLVVNSRATHIHESAEEYYGFPFSFSYQRMWTPDVMRFGKIGFFVTLLFYTMCTTAHMMRHRYDVMYSRNEWTLAWLNICFPRRKTVYESHEAKWSWPVRFLMRRGVRCVVISDGIAKEYRKKGVNDEQIVVAHDGIDETFLSITATQKEARIELGLDEAKKYVFYIGGLDAWKGVETFFSASLYAPNAVFVVVGGKPEKIKEYQMKYKEVLFLGERPYKELALNQKAADILVVPNTAKNALSERYTSPLKLFAHLASGVPLLVSDIPSLLSVVSEREVTVFHSDDAEDLGRQVELLLAHPNESATKAAVAKELAQKYTWKKRAESIINFIE